MSTVQVWDPNMAILQLWRVHGYMQTFMHALCTQIYTRMHIHVRVWDQIIAILQLCMATCMYTCRHSCMTLCTQINTRMHIHVRAWIYTTMHVTMHTCINTCLLGSFESSRRVPRVILLHFIVGSVCAWHGTLQWNNEVHTDWHSNRLKLICRHTWNIKLQIYLKYFLPKCNLSHFSYHFSICRLYSAVWAYNTSRTRVMSQQTSKNSSQIE